MPEEKPKSGGMQRVAEEAFTPAATEYGKELVPLGKEAGALTTRVGLLLLKPLGALVYGLERVWASIEKDVAERLKDVPKDKIVEPQPRIAVPAMQALTYSLDEEYIRKMFVNLLAADMNADAKQNVHPAFVELIKEMTSIEAKVLSALEVSPQIAGRIRFGTPVEFIQGGCVYSFTVTGVEKKEFPKALSNLDRLGLIEFGDTYPTGFEKWGKNVEEECKRQFIANLDEKGFTALATSRFPDGEGNVDFRGIYLTDLGKAFVDICMKGLK
jgi:abortive infection alpha-like protein